MNAFAVIPCTCSAIRAVKTVTPVANMPSVLSERKSRVSVEPCTELELAAERGLVEGGPECLGGSDGLVDSDLELRGSRAFHLWTDSDVMREAGFSPPLAQPVN